jgi:hypothetical protein
VHHIAGRQDGVPDNGATPEYRRPPIAALILAFVAAGLVAIVAFELWPQPVPALIIGFVSGLVPLWFQWRGSALPAVAEIDEGHRHLRARRLRVAYASVAVLAIIAVILWPLRR